MKYEINKSLVIIMLIVETCKQPNPSASLILFETFSSKLKYKSVFIYFSYSFKANSNLSFEI
jgi:hypothetical protein